MEETQEMMTEAQFLKLLDNLADAFRILRLETRCALAYWEELKHIPKNDMIRQIKTIKRCDERFPSIARLYQATNRQLDSAGRVLKEI